MFGDIADEPASLRVVFCADGGFSVGDYWERNVFVDVMAEREVFGPRLYKADAGGH